MDNNKKSRKDNFVVQIQSCHNSTWQGTVTWLEDNRKEYFRSLLELVRLVDSALGEEE